VGNNQPVEVKQVVRLIEQALGRTAVCDLVAMQPGDVPATYADVDALAQAVDFAPRTPVEVGIRRFVDWFTAYHAR
jgi:UDP-glucuronate 4-epimerase